MRQISAIISRILLVGLAFLISACGGGSSENTPGTVVDLDKKGERQLLRFYFGGYVAGEPRDPFESGLLREVDGRVILSDSAIASGFVRELNNLVGRAGDDGVIGWDEFEAFILETYPAVRDAPETVEEARRRYGNWSNDSTWFSVDVTGSMSPYRRHIAVPRTDLHTAIDRMESLNSEIVYPVGTVFIGEHVAEDAVVETTVMVKRTDGMWDYFAYGRDGTWARTIDSRPNDLKVPTQCVGCHFGTRQFEPERSFPGRARPGPHGQRLVHVDERLRSSDIAGSIREHLKRSDTILGLYVTLYLTRLRISDEGDLDLWEAETVNRLFYD